MSKLSDKVAYIRGLSEGMQLDTASNEGRILQHVIAALGDIAEKIDELDNGFDDLNEYVEGVDEDLESLELRCHEEFGDEDEDDDDFDDDFDLDDDEEDDDEDDDEDADDEDIPDEDVNMYTGCICPECGGMFSVEANHPANKRFICPHCSARVLAVRMNCTNVPVAESAEKGEDDE